MTASEKVIAIARGELGYREKGSPAMLDDKTANAGSGNFTKYARDLDAVSDFYNGLKQGYAWCDVFVDWCFYKAFGAERAKKLLCQPDRSAGAGCAYSAQYFERRGQFFSSGPQAGDQIFFGPQGGTHTGLVVRVANGRVYTIEGNSADGVYERSYVLGAGNIYGYGRPDWSLVEQNPSQSPAERASSDVLPELDKGCTGETVRAAQLLLIGRGFSCGPDGADGDFGGKTLDAVLRYQRQHGLAADGVIGVKTWTALLTEE